MSVSKRFVLVVTTLLSAAVLLAMSVGRLDARSSGPKTQAKQPVVISLFDDAAMQRVQATGALPAKAADGTPYVERFFNRVGGQTYVVQRGWDNHGNCRAWAANVEAVGTPVAKDSCTGNPCSSCSFTHSATGAITGCKCNDNPPHADHICNHSISTAFDPADPAEPIERQN